MGNSWVIGLGEGESLKESGGAHRPQQAVDDGLPRSPSKPLAPPGPRILADQRETGREGLGVGTILPAIPAEDITHTFCILALPPIPLGGTEINEVGSGDRGWNRIAHNS